MALNAIKKVRENYNIKCCEKKQVPVYKSFVIQNKKMELGIWK